MPAPPEGPARVPAEEPADTSDPAPFAPFACEGTERLVESPWCTLRRDDVRLENGSRRQYYVFEVSPAVVVVPVLPDGSILTLWQYRYPIGASHWEIPAGRMDPGESPRQAAARELLEETGHGAEELRELPGFFPINGISPHRAHAFVALGCRRLQEPVPDETERFSVHAMPAEEVHRRLRRGDFEDGFTALALFHHFAREAEGLA